MWQWVGVLLLVAIALPVAIRHIRANWSSDPDQPYCDHCLPGDQSPPRRHSRL